MLGSRPSFKTKNRLKIRLLCAGRTRRVINLILLRLLRTRLVLVPQYSAAMDGTADSILIGIRGLVGQMQREDGAKKVRRGMAGVIRDGRHAGRRACGYRAVPGKLGKLEIVEDEAAIVRRIFAAYAAGRPAREIAHDLGYLDLEQKTLQPVRHEVVTHVLGTVCYLCVRAGQGHMW